MTYNYNTYQLWDTLPPVILGIIILIIIVALCLNGFRKGDRAALYSIGKATFRESVKRTKKGDKTCYMLFGHSVSEKILYYLGIFCFSIWLSVFGTFWAVFLIDESFGCDERLDCFPFNTSSNASNTTNGLIQDYPIDNCADFILDDNVEIHCYRFVLNYAEALGTAGGVLIIATTIIEGHLELLIWLKDKLSEVESHEVCKCIAWFGLFSIAGIIPYLLAAAIFIVGVSVPFFADIWLKTGPSKVMFYSYSLTILISSVFSIYILINLKMKGPEEEPLLQVNQQDTQTENS